jgi:hypothetical protein
MGIKDHEVTYNLCTYLKLLSMVYRIAIVIIVILLFPFEKLRLRN